MAYPARERFARGIGNPFRRFYRRKYDAQKVMAAFARTARDETDLNKLTDEMIRVVDETIQPASVSVWMKKTDTQRSKGGQ